MFVFCGRKEQQIDVMQDERHEYVSWIILPLSYNRIINKGAHATSIRLYSSYVRANLYAYIHGESDKIIDPKATDANIYYILLHDAPHCMAIIWFVCIS